MPFDAKPVLAAAASLDAVGVSRDGRPLLDDVTLELRPGARTAIMGSNGAGKSLLLRVLKGLIAPCRGRAEIGGAPLDAQRAAEVGLVLQKPILLRRSARANLEHALRVYGCPRRDRATRAEALLAAAGLAEHGDRPARALSGGQQQRLSIARAMAAEPRILLLDEPTANLDPHATQAVETLIGAAAAQGVAIAIVTHDAGQARRVADEVVFLDRGRVAERSDACAFFDGPRSDAAQAYLDGRLHL